MKNTKIFNFKFVDRVKERNILSQFLSHKLESNVLWIDGPSGVGKTYFVEKNILSQQKENVIYLNKSGETSLSYLSQFINALSDSPHISFREFLKANYISIFDIVKKITVNFLSANSIDELGLIENGLDFTKLFLSKNKEQHNMTKVIENYLKYISKKSKILIILDNFTQCEEESVDLFSAVFYNQIGNPNVQFIVITTTEQLKNRLDILSCLAEKIDVVRISLNAFENSTYFFDILKDSFDLQQCDWKDIKLLFEACSGLPQKLKIFLMNLYSQNGIDYQNEKAIFAYDKLQMLLQKELITFDYDHLPKEQKFILRVIVEWGMPIEITLLLQLTEYIANIDMSLQEFTNAVLRKALLELENIGILEKIYETNICKIKVKHDSIYYAISRLLEKNTVKSSFFHFCMLQFIDTKCVSLPHNNLLSLKAYHSYMSRSDGWQEFNLKYGLTLAKEQQYIKAEKIFERLSKSIRTLDPPSKLSIALNAYNAGEFEKAQSILNLLESVKLSSSEYFALQTTYCRIYMITLDYQHALESINLLLDGRLQINTVQYLEALYLKEVALCLAPKGYIQAKKLFTDIIQKYHKEDSMYWVTRIYRTAMDYYRGDKSKQYLKAAINIAKELDDQEEYAKASHNYGFECFRCGEYVKALENFQICKTILENIKPHEISYCLNNIAVIQMVNHNFSNALETLSEALFWNKSDYATITIKGNQMLCHYYLNHEDEYKQLKTFLLEYLKANPPIDDKIYKKIYTNVAVIAVNQGEYSTAKKLLNKCLPYLKTETPHSSARVKNLLCFIDGHTNDYINLDSFTDYYINLPFEPWVLTFGNE